MYQKAGRAKILVQAAKHNFSAPTDLSSSDEEEETLDSEDGMPPLSFASRGSKAEEVSDKHATHNTHSPPPYSQPHEDTLTHNQNVISSITTQRTE